jgi:hypothetical protein
MQSKYGNANLLLFLPSAVANNHLGKLHSDLWGRLQWRDPTTLTLKPYLLILYTVILGSAPQGPTNSIPIFASGEFLDLEDLEVLTKLPRGTGDWHANKPYPS